jgi:protein MpaA
LRVGQRRLRLIGIVVVTLVGALLLLPGCEDHPTVKAAEDTTARTATSGATAPTATAPSAEAATTTTSESPFGRQTIGRSVQGRPIELFSLGSGSRVVLIIGGIHGDETGAEVAKKLLGYLELIPDALPAGVRLRVVPSANPDGEAVGTRGNANGVDINRNFPSHNWSSRLNPSDPNSAGLTGGAAPGSEPETQALLGCLSGNCDLVISLHSAGGIIDYDGAAAAPIAERMSAASGLPVGHLVYQNYVTGSLGAYVPERYGVPVITVELKDATLTAALRTALLTALGP